MIQFVYGLHKNFRRQRVPRINGRLWLEICVEKYNGFYLLGI